ncbi:hypothetical protein Q3A66_16500 [Hymenobacter sp. BT770]|uniref:hypothetical protein n=1 Tax=Hymenobacter sp. BT770 TaxID=2886942 RepID=UPI001D0F6AB7|nr:hypothetical protein [Hymenobacter sp. BT770]MCC3154617.1 hypothetical protein [Hymenobacter sp. BT770]MDO3416671.1 hypothetical protein [Hymenobacter sp. BT770]
MITSKAVLEYLKVFLSWPPIILVLGGWFLLRFGKEIKTLISNVRNVEAFGAKVVVEAQVAAVDATLAVTAQPKRDEINLLPEGQEKNDKILELEAELAESRQKALAAVRDSSM